MLAVDQRENEFKPFQVEDFFRTIKKGQRFGRFERKEYNAAVFNTVPRGYFVGDGVTLCVKFFGRSRSKTSQIAEIREPQSSPPPYTK